MGIAGYPDRARRPGSTGGRLLIYYGLLITASLENNVLPGLGLARDVGADLAFLHRGLGLGKI